MANAVEKLANQIAGIDNRLTAYITTPRLGQSSIENGAIDAYDETGQLTLSVGLQADGTTAAVSLAGPKPPVPTAPVIESGQLSLSVRWDGLFTGEDGLPDLLSVAPMDFTRVEVHVSDDPDFDPKLAVSLVGTIETPRGAPVVVSPLASKPYYVRLVTRTQSGKFSDASSINSATPLPALDTAALEAELADLETAIENAAGTAAAELDEAMASVAGDLVDLGQQINLARTEPITDERFSPDSLSVWPFKPGAIPAQSIGTNEIADFSILVRKLKSNRHHLY
jgi:hypothetical protein